MSFVDDIVALVATSANPLVQCPAAWPRVELGHVAKIVNGYPFKSTRFNTAVGTPVARIRDVLRGKSETLYDGPDVHEALIDDGDLLVGMDGDFNLGRWKGGKALLNQRVCRLVPDLGRLDPRYLAYALPGYLKLINDNTPSTTVKHLSSRTLAKVPLPLPPRDVQATVADRIDELLSELDDGEEELARARADLETYRNALLKAAVTGELTAEWRRANPDAPAWELKPLIELIAEGPANGWSPPKSASGGGVLALKLTATTSGRMRLDPDCVKDTGVEVSLDSNLYLRPGDLLFQRGNTREYVGIAAIYDGPPHSYIYPDLLIRVRPRSSDMGRWLWRYANSPLGRAYMMGEAKGAAGTMPKITGKVVREMLVPVPPEDEMRILLESIEQHLGDSEDTAVAATSIVGDAAILRQSILAAAFRGELVQ